MARLRRKYPPKNVFPSAAYRVSETASIPPTYIPRQPTVDATSSSLAHRSSPSTLLEPLLSSTSSASSISGRSSSTASRRQGSTGSTGVASSILTIDSRLESENRELKPTLRRQIVVGSTLVRRGAAERHGQNLNTSNSITPLNVTAPFF